MNLNGLNDNHQTIDRNQYSTYQYHTLLRETMVILCLMLSIVFPPEIKDQKESLCEPSMKQSTTNHSELNIHPISQSISQKLSILFADSKQWVLDHTLTSSIDRYTI